MKKREVKMALLLAFLVRVTGLEPARQRHKILNLARLPIPPHPQINGGYRARTCDPLLVRQMLSQLSYAPISY